MKRGKVNVFYLLLGLSYIAYYFTHLPQLYIFIGLLYLMLAFKH